MRSYICEGCKGHCDAGELIGGKCPECREKERHRETMQDRKVKLSNASFEQMTLDLGGYAVGGKNRKQDSSGFGVA